MQKVKTRVLSVFMALTLAMTMLVGVPTTASADISEYDSGDIAVIEAIIDNNGLGWLKASTVTPTTDVDADWMNANWPTVRWDSSTPKRIIGLSVNSQGLNGTLDLSGLDALGSLDCNGNSLSGLDVSSNTALVALECVGNNLYTLNVDGLSNLEYLKCSNNYLSSLDVSSLSNLVYLICPNNDLDTLTLGNHTNLALLECYNNNLSTLDISGCTSLTELYCWDNNLSVLDLSGLTGLIYLECSGNNLSALDVSAQVALFYLGCSGNNLSSLDVSNKTLLRYLDCSGNQLTTLDVSGLSALRQLYCDNNFMADLSKVNVTGATLLPVEGVDAGGYAFMFFPQRVPVCEIVGGAKYETLDAALAAVPTGGATPTVIKLLVDITKDDYTEINNQNIIFDLDGKNLIFAGGLGVTDTSAVDYTNAGAGLFAVIVEWDSSTDYDVFYVLYVSGGSTCRLMYVEIVGIGDGENQLLGAVTCWTGSTIIVEGDVVAMHNGDSWAVGVLAEYDNTETSTVTVNGDIITNGDGIWAYEGTTVTINGDIEAGGNGIYAFDSTTVTINGDIEAGGDGIYASGSTVTVTGGINAGFDGVYISSGSPTVVVVDGEIHAGWVGVNIDSWDGPTRDATVTVNSDIFAYYAGVATWECEDCIVTVNGNITADYIGVFAWTGVEVFVNGNIVVTEDAALSLDSILVGVAAGFGAEVTVDGTITVKEGHYIALYFEDAGDPGYSYVFVAPDGNITPSSKDKFLEYNDSDELQLVSTVWVKDPRTLTPGTGDGTALWLMLGALMVAALGTGLVFAHRRREQQDAS